MQINYVSITMDALGGQRVGNLLRHSSTFMEVLAGDRLGLPAPGVYNAIFMETLAGHAVGANAKFDRTTKEVIGGEHIGLNVKPQFISNTMEVIGRDSSYKFISDVREVIGSTTGEWVSIAYEVRQVRALAARRQARQAPPVVWSYTPVAGLVQQVLRRSMRARPISVETAYTLRQATAQQRAASPPAGVLSTLRTGMIREQVAMSRTIVYTPVSGVSLRTMRQALAMRRPTTALPGTVRSPILVRTDVQLVLRSRRTRSWEVKQHVQMVARTRFTTITPIFVATDSELVLQSRPQTPPISPLTVKTAVQQLLQLRTTAGIEHSITRAATLVQQLAVDRTLPLWWSDLQAVQVVQVLAQQRAPIAYASRLYVLQDVQLVAALRVPAALPYTGETVLQAGELVAQHRETAPPNAISSWDVKVMLQQLAARRVTGGIVHSFTQVATIQVQYGLAAVYPPPDEVIGPERGAQVKQQRMLAAQLRVTDPPSDISTRSRFVFNALEQIATGDTFPSKDTPYSDADVFSMVSPVAVVDEPWPDPRIAFSDAEVFSVTTAIAVVDEPWPDPRVPRSPADVFALHEAALLGDTFPDPLVPVSTVDVRTVGQFAAVGGVLYPDPAIPVSELRSWLVGANAVVGDAVAFADPHAPTSNAEVFSLAMALVLRDKALLSIPARTDRRRAIVSIAIS